MSFLNYGGVTMQMVKTNQVIQEPVYTDDGIDYLYTRFFVSATCVWSIWNHADMHPAIPPGLFFGVPSPMAIDASIRGLRAILEQPRQHLVISFSGSNSAGACIDVGGPDCKGGPFPRGVNIEKVYGTNLVYVTLQIEAFKRDCPNGESDNGGAISNRWSVNTEYDENCLATRTISGTLYCDGRYVPQPDAAAFRQMVFPTIPKGWKRQSFLMAPTSDRLRLNYSITDKEMIVTPPEGATSATGSYTERTSPKGAVVFGEMSVSVTGSRATTKQQLISIAARMVLSRFNFPKDVLESASISETLFDKNEVTMNVVAMRTVVDGQGPNVVGQKALVAFFQNFGKTLPGTETNIADYCGPMGLSLVKTDLARNADACGAPDRISDWISIATPGGSNAGDADGTTPVQTPNEGGGDLPGLDHPSQTPSWMRGHIEGPSYHGSQMHIDYDTSHGRLLIPVAGDSSEMLGPEEGGSSGGLSDIVRSPFAIFKTHKPFTRKRINYRAKRNENWPEAPKLKSEISNQGKDGPVTGFLQDSSIQVTSPELGPDTRTLVKEIDVEAVYVFSGQLDETNNELDAGRLPHIATEENANAVDRVPTDIWTEEGIVDNGPNNEGSESA